jgi:hypothetical protein
MFALSQTSFFMTLNWSTIDRLLSQISYFLTISASVSFLTACMGCRINYRNLYLACHFPLNYYVTGNIVPILSSAKRAL